MKFNLENFIFFLLFLASLSCPPVFFMVTFNIIYELLERKNIEKRRLKYQYEEKIKDKLIKGE